MLLQQSEEDIATLEMELQGARDQIAELRTANMRLENENESLLALEERAASLTEENARLEALARKAHDIDAIEKERDEAKWRLEEFSTENRQLEEDVRRYSSIVEEQKDAIGRYKKQACCIR